MSFGPVLPTSRLNARSSRYLLISLSILSLLLLTIVASFRGATVAELHEKLRGWKGHDLNSNKPSSPSAAPSKSASSTLSSSPTEITTHDSIANIPLSSSSLDYYTFDVVVSLYEENLTEVRSLLDTIKATEQLKQYNEVRVFVYSKKESADLEIQNTLDATVATLPNRGREGGTYLAHILEHWNDIGSHTLFIQAAPHHSTEAIRRMQDYLVPPSKSSKYDVPETGMLTLGWIDKCQCTLCHDMGDGARTWSRIPEMYSVLNGKLCLGEVVLTYLGQMIVSRKRILSRRKEAYQYLKDILEADMEHWIHEDEKEQEFMDSVTNPYFGHTLERGWMVLWGCDDPSLLDRCGGGLGAFFNPRGPGEPASKCQCMDE